MDKTKVREKVYKRREPYGIGCKMAYLKRLVNF